MSLSGDDKSILIRLHLEKSHMYLQDYEQLMALDALSSAANRLYYAVFQNRAHETCRRKSTDLINIPEY